MKPLDYGRSFLIGKAGENEVRFWAESRTRIIDERSGACEDYIQTGSCKSEDTFAEHDLFYEDNYDFLPIFGPEWGLIFRRKVCLTPTYKSVVPTQKMWGGQVYHLVEAEACEELPDNQRILAATHACRPLVAQIELADAGTGLRAIVECPVKTMNTHRGRNLYQVDTGPVVLPDLSVRRERHADGMQLAFVAFNVPGFADWVIESPTPVGPLGQTAPDAPQAYHYSRRVSLPTTNRLLAIL